MLSEVCRHIVYLAQGPVACLYSIADYSCEGKSDRICYYSDATQHCVGFLLDFNMESKYPFRKETVSLH